VPQGLSGKKPNDIFNTFRDHLNSLLHHTITEVPLLQTITGSRAHLEFRLNRESIGVEVGKGYHLYLSQALEAHRIKSREYRLKTLAYAYRIGEGPKRGDRWIIRWEYNSREHLEALHPRHHCHLPFELTCFGDQSLNLDKMHISSGWVTVEEVIRFLIHELKVKPKHVDWDKRLRDSEQKFREWTARSV
jgi:hypothetical protein